MFRSSAATGFVNDFWHSIRYNYIGTTAHLTHYRSGIPVIAKHTFPGIQESC